MTRATDESAIQRSRCVMGVPAQAANKRAVDFAGATVSSYGVASTDQALARGPFHITNDNVAGNDD